MLSARTIYGEIFDNDEAFGLFCSIAASGEAPGGAAAHAGGAQRAGRPGTGTGQPRGAAPGPTGSP